MSWKAEETAAARWRRSNSACWAAGSLGGAGREEKVDERRREGRRLRLSLRGRRGGIFVFCLVVVVLWKRRDVCRDEAGDECG